METCEPGKTTGTEKNNKFGGKFVKKNSQKTTNYKLCFGIKFLVLLPYQDPNGLRVDILVIG